MVDVIRISEPPLMVAFLEERNSSVASIFREMLVARLKELAKETPQQIYVCRFTNEPGLTLELPPGEPLPEGLYFFWIYEMTGDALANEANTLFVIDLNAGTVLDQTANQITIQ